MKNNYPSCISTAAKLLDKECPEWYTKISKPIDMSHWTTCILGQAYGSYEKGMKVLFGHGPTSQNSFDMIFGREASVGAWQLQIKARKPLFDNPFSNGPIFPKVSTTKNSKNSVAKISAEVYTVYYDNQTIKVKTNDMPMLINMFQKVIKGE